MAVIDLHWPTSEHSVNDVKGVLEAQLHHFDLAHDSFDTAVGKESAVVSLAIMFKARYIQSYMKTVSLCDIAF